MPAAAALIVIIPAVATVIVMPRLAAGLHLVVAPGTLLVAWRTLAPAVLPTTT
jgi:hypothetical protein